MYILASDVIEAGREMVIYVKLRCLLSWLVGIPYPPFLNTLVSLIMRWDAQKRFL